MRLLAAALLALGLVLSATVVPGVFITDDNNYLINVIALRQGRVTVANTAGLTPSRELLAFDPGPSGRTVDSTPVASNAPPLYGPLALPFSFLGWRGLVALNTLAYLATIALVFVYAGRYANQDSTPWLAAGAFAFGGYVIEYAQGVWPHALSLALCTAGVFAAGRVVGVADANDLSPAANRSTSGLAATAGLWLGLAAGVRYQNAVILAVVGAAIFLWTVRPWKALIAFGLGATAPLMASAAINHARLGSWNPISKGQGYLRVPLLEDPARSLDPAVMFWARLVDFSARPPLLGFSWVTYDPVTGGHLMAGQTLQKAFLQSAPWAILALIVFVAAWRSRFALPESRRRQLRLLSLVTFAVLMSFSVSGVRRHEGLAFNQRYLLELLPFVAVGFAWALDGFKLRTQPLVVGGLWGALLVFVSLFATPSGGEGTFGSLRQLSVLKLPLLLTALVGTLWFLGQSRERARPLLAAAAGLCLGWGLTLHVFDDLAASRRLRARKLVEARVLAGVVTDGSAVVAYTAYKDAAFPLLFTRDLVILDASADEGRDAPLLIRELLARDRRVFVIASGFPRGVLPVVLDDFEVHPVISPGLQLLELRAPRTD